ncbi:MAG TPA: 50S ribosomal protein L9, partial [Thermosynergistes sp.]|nr:50S ribosomal protein L9 [Thermosynergistes sp.]
MKVILKQDVEKLGRRGDLVEVADGYGRNFLIPRGLAVEATEAKLREWKSIQEGKAAREKRSEEEARAKKKNLQGKRITV